MPLLRGIFFCHLPDLLPDLPDPCRTFAELFRRECLVPLNLPDLPDHFAQTLAVQQLRAAELVLEDGQKRKCNLIFDFGLASPANGRFGQCLQGRSRFFRVWQVRQGSGKSGKWLF